MKKRIDKFETFDAVLDALKPARRLPPKWKRVSIARKAVKGRDVLPRRRRRAAKAEAHKLIRSPTMDRPTYKATAELGKAAQRGEYVGRWFSCLGAMEVGRSYTLIGLEGVWTLDKPTAFSVVRTLRKRALVSRCVNPGAVRGMGSRALRNPNREAVKDRWLYERLEPRATDVLSGAVEWRRPMANRYGPWKRYR